MKSEVYSQLYNILSENSLADVLDEIAAICFDEGEECPGCGWLAAGELVETLSEHEDIKRAGKAA